jgi:NitT/TauT family transport system substrate-binding protein
MLARDIIIKSIPNLNPALKNLMTLPEYHSARLPDEAYLAKIIEWTRTVVDQDLNVEPADLVDTRFVD